MRRRREADDDCVSAGVGVGIGVDLQSPDPRRAGVIAVGDDVGDRLTFLVRQVLAEREPQPNGVVRIVGEPERKVTRKPADPRPRRLVRRGPGW